MPRFYFDVHDGKIVPDDVGTELSDVDDARNFACRMILRMALSTSLARDAVQLRVNVCDAEGARVLTGTLLFLIEPTE